MINDMVSIIIPTYNRGKLIKKAIESVLNQTYKNIEVIVVDDGSTDDTEKKVKKISDSRLKYFKYSKNRGACYARNYGIMKASGEYIAFQDSDDYFYPDKIEKQLLNMKECNTDIDFVKININEGNNIHFAVPSDELIEMIKKDGYVNVLCNCNYISTQAIMVKKSLLEKYMFDESLPRLQDYDLILRMVNDNNVSFTNEVLCELYKQPDSISNNTTKLENAVSIMVNKKYPLSMEQRIRLNNKLYDLLIYNLKNDFNVKFNELYETNQGLSLEYNQIKQEKEKFENKYLSIINSKRWKLIDRLCKIFKK